MSLGELFGLDYLKVASKESRSKERQGKFHWFNRDSKTIVEINFDDRYQTKPYTPPITFEEDLKIDT